MSLLIPFLHLLLAHLYCVDGHRSVAQDFRHSAIVLVGDVVSIEEYGEHEGWIYSVTVVELLKGRPSPSVPIQMGNDTGRLDSLEVGRRYVFFAYQYENKLWVDNCGNTGPWTDRQKELHEARRLQSRSSSK